MQPSTSLNHSSIQRIFILHLQWAKQRAKFWGNRDFCLQNSEFCKAASEEMGKHGTGCSKPGQRSEHSATHRGRTHWPALGQQRWWRPRWGVVNSLGSDLCEDECQALCSSFISSTYHSTWRIVGVLRIFCGMNGAVRGVEVTPKGRLVHPPASGLSHT